MRQQARGTLEALVEAFGSLPPVLAPTQDPVALGQRWVTACRGARPPLPEDLIAAAFAIELLRSLPATAADAREGLRELTARVAALTGLPAATLERIALRAPQDGDADGLALAAAAATAAPPAAPVQGERASAAESQLTRLRFDLHDGPLQDVLLLAEDLRMFQTQLESALVEHPLRARLVGRLEDLKAMLVALDGDLRRISALLESPFLRGEPFPEALEQLTNAFAGRTEIIPTTALEGDFSTLSDTHQMTLLGLIREALSNIREHSDADRVSIEVRSDGDGVLATVTDNGRGFDPETALLRAARDGHLGLVGMHERVRMLGGVTQIDSRPGGPTTISVSLPSNAEDGGESFTFSQQVADPNS